MSINFRDQRISGDDIELKPQSINASGWATIVPYMTSRYPRKVLDEAVTPLGWQSEFVCIGDVIFCGISIWDNEKKQWIKKFDVGTQDNGTEKAKTLASDGSKRASAAWGIGWELYELDAIGVQLNDDEYKVFDNKGKPTYKLKLKQWKIDLIRDEKTQDIIRVDLYDENANLRTKGAKAVTTKSEVPNQSTAPSSTTNPTDDTPPPPKPAKTIQFLNETDVEKWAQAKKFLEEGGSIDSILKKYRVSKANKEKLQSFIKKEA